MNIMLQAIDETGEPWEGADLVAGKVEESSSSPTGQFLTGEWIWPREGSSRSIAFVRVLIPGAPVQHIVMPHQARCHGRGTSITVHIPFQCAEEHEDD